MVQPHFDYCSAVWGNCRTSLKKKLQKLQNRAARIIAKSPYEVASNEVLLTLGWSLLETRRKCQICLLMYKIMNGLAPNCLQGLILTVSETHPYNLYHSDSHIKIPQPLSEYGKRSFRYSGALWWNSLPSAIRHVNHTTVFKNFINSYSFH